MDVEGKAVLVPEEAELTLRPEGAIDTEFVVVVQSGEVDRLRLVLVYAWAAAAGPAAYHWWTDIVTSSALPMVVLGDFNKDALRDPQLSRVIKEWGYQVQPPWWAWAWWGAGAHAGQHSMIDFVLVPDGLLVRECRLVGRMPVEVSFGGGGGGHTRRGGGSFPGWPRQVQVPEQQWERFARDHETWSSTWEPHPDLPLHERVERTLQILCEAVGPRVGTADI